MVTREAATNGGTAVPGDTRTPSSGPPGHVADALAPVLTALIGRDARVRITFWDGSAIGPDDAVGTLAVRSPDALRRIVWAPGELGVSRAFVAGELSVEGDIFEVLAALPRRGPGRTAPRRPTHPVRHGPGRRTTRRPRHPPAPAPRGGPSGRAPPLARP